MSENGRRDLLDGSSLKPAQDHTLGQLVAEASRDLSALIQAEVQLAKSELSFSAKAGGIGTAMFLVAGFIAVLVSVLVSIGLALLLASFGIGAAWAFFIVAGVYLLIAALVIVIGIVLIKKVKAPTATISTAKEIPAAFKS